MIPYSTQNINPQDERAVLKALRSGWLTQGQEIESFERELAKACDATHAVVVSNGTAALHAAYVAAGINAGDEVITTPLTFAATANMLLAIGAKPVFADVDPSTGNLDPREVEKKITSKTVAIVPVDYGGNPVDLDSFKRLAKKHGLVLIEDAAQALGATYKKKRIGSIADLTTFSFHPVKSITTGEGGAILTNNERYAARMKLFRTHGVAKNPRDVKKKNAPAWYQEMQLLGFNYRLTDIQAALGRSQLRRLDAFIAKRRAVAARYVRLLKRTSLILPAEDALRESAWHLFPVRLDTTMVHRRNSIFKKLREHGIGVQVHHLPVYLHPYYRQLGYTKGLCPNAEAFVDAELSLPIFPALTEIQQRFIVRTLLQLLG